MVRYAVLFLALAFLSSACAPTKQARSVETTGFLGTIYSLMHKGGEGEALLVYKNPKVAEIPRGTYKKMLLDHVQVWGEPRLDAARQADAQKAADLLYALAYQSLSQDYEMVTEPGPNTLHVQAAITRADQDYVALRVISSIPAPMNVLAVASLVKQLGTGKPLFVGEASVEMRIADSLTGEVLAASVDRRVGKKRLDADSFDSWDDVHKTLAYWVELMRYRLCEARHDQGCVKPND